MSDDLNSKWIDIHALTESYP